jgi:TM2 domain-containing membrane protein YozV
MAIVLALLLGGIGAHKFYLRRPGTGILYILFSWTMIPAAVAFIEGLSYLFLTDAEFSEKYGEGVVTDSPGIRRQRAFTLGCVGVLIVLLLLMTFVAVTIYRRSQEISRHRLTIGAIWQNVHGSQVRWPSRIIVGADKKATVVCGEGPSSLLKTAIEGRSIQNSTVEMS